MNGIFFLFFSLSLIIPDSIEGGVYYIQEENNKLTPMPLFDIKLLDSHRKVLKEFGKGNKSTLKLSKNTGKSRGQWSIIL